jgi:hypothetical protein
MNDSDIELRLGDYFRHSPKPELPERLQAAVTLDRARPARRLSVLPHGPRARTVSALAGLAATFVLAVGLLAIVANRPTQSPGASPITSGRIERIDWQVGHLPSADSISILKMLNGNLMYFQRAGEQAGNVWSFDRTGGSWIQLTSSSPFDSDQSGDYTLQNVVEDGEGGLVAYGAQGTAAVVWRSRDGRTWTATQLGSGIVNLVAAGPTGLVAIGFAPSRTGDCESTNSTAVWALGSDGKWAQTSLPGGAIFPISAVLWHGQIVVSGNDTCWESVPAWSTIPPDFRGIWTSSDGTSWRRIAVTGVPSDLDRYYYLTLVAHGDRLVACDGGRKSNDVLVSSTDLTTWQTVALPAVSGKAPGVIAAFDDSGELVVIGADGTIWTSSDGEAWQTLASNSWGSAASFAYPSGASFSGDQIVLPDATLADGSSGYLIGTIVRAKPAPTPTAATASPTASASATALAEPNLFSLQLVNAASWVGSTPDALVATSDRFYAFVGTRNGPTVWASTDGSSWAQTADSSAFVLAGSGGATVLTGAVRGPGPDGGVVAVGYRTNADSSSSQGVAWYSSDGATWHEAVIAGETPPDFMDLAWYNGTFVASGGTPYYSTDGKTWHAASIDDPSNVLGSRSLDVTAWAGGLLAVSGGESWTVWSSDDGKAWTRLSDWNGPTTGIAMDLYPHGAGLMALLWGLEGEAIWWWSPDGSSWEATDGPGTCLGVGQIGDWFAILSKPAGSDGTVPMWVSRDDSSAWHELPDIGLPFELNAVYRIEAIGNRVVILGGLNGTSAWYGDLVVK